MQSHNTNKFSTNQRSVWNDRPHTQGRPRSHGAAVMRKIVHGTLHPVQTTACLLSQTLRCAAFLPRSPPPPGLREIRFFFKAIHSSKPALDDQPQRVENLRRSLRFTVYSWVTRGLFEKHRLIFLTQVTFGLLQVRPPLYYFLFSRIVLGKPARGVGVGGRGTPVSALAGGLLLCLVGAQGVVASPPSEGGKNGWLKPLFVKFRYSGTHAEG